MRPVSDPVIKPLLPVWPVASILPVGKDVRRKKPAKPPAEQSSARGKTGKGGRKHIDLYA
jgi:hypothetical protein